MAPEFECYRQNWGRNILMDREQREEEGGGKGAPGPLHISPNPESTTWKVHQLILLFSSFQIISLQCITNGKREVRKTQQKRRCFSLVFSAKVKRGSWKRQPSHEYRS
jgi:hypothetical protein